jgi:hypothetical protein
MDDVAFAKKSHKSYKLLGMRPALGYPVLSRTKLRDLLEHLLAA